MLPYVTFKSVPSNTTGRTTWEVQPFKYFHKASKKSVFYYFNLSTRSSFGCLSWFPLRIKTIYHWSNKSSANILIAVNFLNISVPTHPPGFFFLNGECDASKCCICKILQMGHGRIKLYILRTGVLIFKLADSKGSVVWYWALTRTPALLMLVF